MAIVLIDEINPKNAGDFPMVQDVYLKGGYRVVANTTARDAITTQRRSEGMAVYVISNTTLYYLNADLTNWTAAPFITGVAWGAITGTLSNQTDLQSALDAKQPLDATLTALAGLNTTAGVVVQTGTDSFTKRTITGTANQVIVADGDGVSGAPTLSLPQSIHTAATPTFAGLTLTALTGLLQGNGASAITAITNSSTVGQVLRVTGASTYAWGALNLADSDAITGDLPFANLTQGSARSVLGVTGNATADVASIQGTANQVLVVNSAGTALAFGQVNLASTSAVVGALPVGNGGTGAISLTSNSLLTGNGTSAIQAETNLVYNGTTLAVGDSNAITGALGVPILNVRHTAGSNLLLSTDVASNVGPGLELGKRRANNYGVVSPGDVLGVIAFSGSDSVDMAYGAAIEAIVNGTPGSNDMPTVLTFWTTPDASGTPVNHMTIMETGKVIVGKAYSGACNGIFNVEKASSAYTYDQAGITVGQNVDSTSTGVFTFLGYNTSTGYGFLDAVDISGGYVSITLCPNGGNVVVGNPGTSVGGVFQVINQTTGSISQAWVTTQTGEDAKTKLYHAYVATTNATVTTLFTFATTTNSTATLDIQVDVIRSGGAAGTAVDSGSYNRKVRVKNAAGTVTVNGGAGAVDITVIHEDAAYTVDCIQSGTNALVRVTGIANTNLSWRGRIMVDGAYTVAG